MRKILVKISKNKTNSNYNRVKYKLEVKDKDKDKDKHYLKVIKILKFLNNNRKKIRLSF